MTKAIEGIKSLFDFDFMGFIASLLPDPNSFAGKALAIAGVYKAVGIDSKTGKKLESDEQVVVREKAEATEEIRQTEVRKKVRGLEEQKSDLGLQDQRNKVAQAKSNAKDRTDAFILPETKEEQALDLKKLKTEQKKLDEINEKRAALDEQIKAAQTPPPNIVSAPTTVNNTNPTSNNTSNSPSLKPAGSSGTYAGSMTNAGFM